VRWLNDIIDHSRLLQRNRPIEDERIAGTIALIENTLVVDGMVRRYRMDTLDAEGMFIACSLWLAECQLDQNRRSAAIATVERVLSVRSPLGLLSEQYDVISRRLSGNFPQALSHLALIQALLALTKFDEARAETVIPILPVPDK
jgi:GH15 family glucan-1,4-alpha-glucosidase